MGRLAEDRAKAPAEVRRRDVGHRSHGAHVEGLGIRAVHGIAGTQEPPIEILRLAAHSLTVRARPIAAPGSHQQAMDDEVS
jgi:hypothetical protein